MIRKQTLLIALAAFMIFLIFPNKPLAIIAIIIALVIRYLYKKRFKR